MLRGRRSMSMGPTASPASRTTSPTYGLNTRRTARSPIMQEEIEALSNRVKDAPSGKTYLESKLLCHIGQPFMGLETSNMVDAISKQVMDSLNVKLADYDIADTISKKITDDITAKLVDHVVTAISPQAALVHDISQTLTPTLEDVRSLHTSIGRERTEKEENIKTAADRIEDAADALYDSVETYQKALQILTPSLDATQEKIDQLSTQISTVLGRAAIQARQILLDPLPGEALFLLNTSNCDIATKIKTALEAARDDTTPEGTIHSVMVLRNSGILVKLESELLAKWLNDPAGRSALENHLNMTVSFCQCQYPVVLEYLPIQMQIEQADFLRHMEHEN
ncbi:hypothetical protein BDR05DRAFT_953726 [Suillus weaverae]|nr:hypothetical protein BDR05DRAFT_953726 [Suillus weaverae]